MTNTCVIPVAIEAGWDGMTGLFRNCSDDLIEKYSGLGEFNGGEPNHGWQGIATHCCGFHEQNFPNLVTEAGKYLRALPYESQAAKDAARSGYGGPKYWAYLDEAAERHNTMERSLADSLTGNQGD